MWCLVLILTVTIGSRRGYIMQNHFLLRPLSFRRFFMSFLRGLRLLEFNLLSLLLQSSFQDFDTKNWILLWLWRSCCSQLLSMTICILSNNDGMKHSYGFWDALHPYIFFFDFFIFLQVQQTPTLLWSASFLAALILCHHLDRCLLLRRLCWFLHHLHLHLLALMPHCWYCFFFYFSLHHGYSKFIFDFLVRLHFVHSWCSRFHYGVTYFPSHLLLLSHKAFVGYFHTYFIWETVLLFIFWAKTIYVYFIGLVLVAAALQDRLLTDLEPIQLQTTMRAFFRWLCWLNDFEPICLLFLLLQFLIRLEEHIPFHLLMMVSGRHLMYNAKVLFLSLNK